MALFHHFTKSLSWFYLLYITCACCYGQLSIFAKPTSVSFPSTLSFAGEQAPLQDQDIKERLERELIQISYQHSTTLLTLKRASRWKNQIQHILKEKEIPEDFFYLAAIESNFDPYANSGKAEGFWQITPHTAIEEGLEVDTNRSSPTNSVDQRRDVVLSTYAFCKIIRKHYEKLNSWTLAALAYNQGLSRTSALLKAQKAKTYYDLYVSPEPYRYVFRILVMKLMMEDPKKYGFELSDEDLYQPFKTKTIEVNSSIENLVDFARDNGINYKTLKYYNPWIVFRPNNYFFEVKPGKSYRFELPLK